jgi:hypothetical protein
MFSDLLSKGKFEPSAQFANSEKICVVTPYQTADSLSKFLTLKEYENVSKRIPSLVGDDSKWWILGFSHEKVDRLIEFNSGRVKPKPGSISLCGQAHHFKLHLGEKYINEPTCCVDFTINLGIE